MTDCGSDASRNGCNRLEKDDAVEPGRCAVVEEFEAREDIKVESNGL